MKKILMASLAVLGLCLSSFAQDAKGTCKMAGTYDYLCADFYKGPSEGTATIRISNQSSIPVLEVKVVVTCETWRQYDDQGNDWRSPFKKETIYSETVYGIPALDYKEIKFTMPKYDKIKNFKITIGNLLCQKQSE